MIIFNHSARLDVCSWFADMKCLRSPTMFLCHLSSQNLNLSNDRKKWRSTIGHLKVWWGSCLLPNGGSLRETIVFNNQESSFREQLRQRTGILQQKMMMMSPNIFLSWSRSLAQAHH